MSALSKYRLAFFVLAAIFVFSGTFISVKLASGYRFDFSTKSFTPRGLLAATSNPYGAELFVNAKLKGATDTTLFLAPGDYRVEITKTGYTTWQKKLKIQKELVTKTDAFLFLKQADLRPLTFNGCQNPKISPDGTRLVYSVPLPDPQAGLWTMELTDFLFNINHSPRQIVQSSANLDFTNFSYFWTPDSRQILVEKTTSLPNQTKEQYLLDGSQLNSTSALVNISDTFPQMLTAWENGENIKLKAELQKLPKEMINILKSSTKDISFSPDGTMVLYLATASAAIQPNLVPLVVAASTQKEERKIEPNKIYIYDIKEDKNFLIPFSLPKPITTPKATKKITGSTASLSPNPYPLTPISWFPTSRHLYWIEENKVVACEYDGTNLTTIYSGPFINPFVFASPGANKLVVLTQLNFEENSLPNLYSVSLK